MAFLTCQTVLHFYQDWRWSHKDSLIFVDVCIQEALVIWMLDQVVSGELDRLGVNRNNGASRFVVAVECSP